MPYGSLIRSPGFDMGNPSIKLDQVADYLDSLRESLIRIADESFQAAKIARDLGAERRAVGRFLVAAVESALDEETPR